ncbi:MAG TPA: response regulator [Chromatiales bacterium]|nr:response regulator [Chromatiales bacterium]
MSERTMGISDLAVTFIEPSSTQRRVISGHLNRLGLSKIDWFNDGESALKDMHQYQPDLVVSAMHLPDMSGTELVQQMRADETLEHIPFMVISSEHSDTFLEPARQAGVVAILSKPFDPEDLKKALYSTLEFIEPDNATLADVDLDDLLVLVVDDSLTARKHICRVLNNLGIENIVQAVNGHEALECMAHQLFDLIVTDYNMPEMDGQELTRYVREKGLQKSIPILMVTSEASSSHLAGIKQAGVSALCDKPFEPGEVKSLIRRILSE